MKLKHLLFIISFCLLCQFANGQSDNRSPYYRIWGPTLVNTGGYSSLADTGAYKLIVNGSGWVNDSLKVGGGIAVGADTLSDAIMFINDYRNLDQGDNLSGLKLNYINNSISNQPRSYNPLDFNIQNDRANFNGYLINGTSTQSGSSSFLGALKYNLTNTGTQGVGRSVINGIVNSGQLSTSHSFVHTSFVSNFDNIASASYNDEIYNIYSQLNVPGDWNNQGSQFVNKYYGIYSDVEAFVSPNTTAYALYLKNSPDTTDFGVYQSSTFVKNYFAGKVGIGVNANYNLDIAGTANISLNDSSYFKVKEDSLIVGAPKVSFNKNSYTSDYQQSFFRTNVGATVSNTSNSTTPVNGIDVDGMQVELEMKNNYDLTTDSLINHITALRTTLTLNNASSTLFSGIASSITPIVRGFNSGNYTGVANVKIVTPYTYSGGGYSSYNGHINNYYGIYFDKSSTIDIPSNRFDNMYGIYEASSLKNVFNGPTEFNALISIHQFTPQSTSDSAGDTGSLSFDANYIYVKTSGGWKRAALTTF